MGRLIHLWRARSAIVAMMLVAAGGSVSANAQDSGAPSTVPDWASGSALDLAPQAGRSTLSPTKLKAMRELAEADGRLNAIGWRMAKAISDWCGRDVAYKIGVLETSMERWPLWDQDLVRAAYNVPEGYDGSFVAAVAPDSPADKAGIRRGMSTPDASRLSPETVCDYEFDLLDIDTQRASAGLGHVQVTLPMARLATTPGDLEAIVAHEIAHLVLRHPLNINISTYSIRDGEIEADRLSVWILARAGYDPYAAARLWERLGPRRIDGLQGGKTHPHWRDRANSVRAEIAIMERNPAAIHGVMPIPAWGDPARKARPKATSQ